MYLVDVTMFFHKESGGVKRYLTAKQAWCRQQRGIRHTVVVPGSEQRPSGQQGFVRVAGRPIPFSAGYRCPVLPRGAARVLESIRPDVIEAGDPYTLAWSALEAGRELGVPVVGFYHSDLPRMIGMRFGNSGRRLAEAYVRELYSRFDLVLAPSEAMVRELHRLGIASARHQPLGVDPQVFRPQSRGIDLKAMLCLPPRTRLLVYVGRFSREKNLHWLCDAMRQLGPSYHLLLIGGGAKLDVPSNVHMLPYVASSSRLAMLLCGCDAFVHAGDKETFGLAVIEAMACGLPVVGMNAGGVAELVPREAGVLVEPAGAAAIAEGISRLFRGEPYAMGVYARRHVRRRYAWSAVFPALLGHYMSLTGTREALTGAPWHLAAHAGKY